MACLIYGCDTVSKTEMLHIWYWNSHFGGQPDRSLQQIVMSLFVCLPRKRRKKGNLLVNHEVHGKWRSPVDFHEILSRREANRSSRIWKPVSNQSHKTIAHKPRLWDGLSHVQHKLCFVVLTSLTDMHLCYNPRIRTASCLPLSPPAANPTKRSLSSWIRVRVGSTWGSTKTSKRQGSRKKMLTDVVYWISIYADFVREKRMLNVNMNKWAEKRQRILVSVRPMIINKPAIWGEGSDLPTFRRLEWPLTKRTGALNVTCCMSCGQTKESGIHNPGPLEARNSTLTKGIGRDGGMIKSRGRRGNTLRMVFQWNF